MKTETKRKICAALSLLGFAFALGVVGSIEYQNLDLRQGVCGIVLGIAIFIFAAHKAGLLK